MVAGPSEAAAEGKVTDAQPSTPVEELESAQPARARAIVLVTEPEALARLPRGLDLGELVFETPGATGQALNAHAAYRSLLNELQLGSGSPSDLPFSSSRGFFAPRRWFTAPNSAFTLVAVVNRIDRRDFGRTACGETRLLYRLAYTDTGGEPQRLPVSFNVIFEQPDDGQGCVEVARRWLVDAGEDEVEALSRAGGALHPSMLTPAQLLSIETNVRLAEGPDAAGMNQLRAFSWDRERARLELEPLEFEPEWKSMMVRRNVRPLLTPEGFAVIDRGAGELPFKINQRWADVHFYAPFVNEVAMMWKRFDNHDEVAPLAETGLSSTRAGLEHRLRGMTCSGCHERRSVAGFHLPGEGGDQLRGGISAHLEAELPWRERYVAALAAGETPELTRQLHNEGPAGVARPCSLEHSPYAELRCDPGFECTLVPLEDFGACMPEDYAGPGPCGASSADCREPSPWFPGGFTRLPCVEGQPCASVVRTTDFSSCKEEDDPWACAKQRAERVRVDGCVQQSECREGYVCVELDEGDTGGCLPQATVAEFRILGHRKRMR